MRANSCPVQTLRSNHGYRESPPLPLAFLISNKQLITSPSESSSAPSDNNRSVSPDQAYLQESLPPWVVVWDEPVKGPGAQ